ncbi:MAG TPA: hypothetical protein VIJ94_09765 [Caulobacteraceae bacterium]
MANEQGAGQPASYPSPGLPTVFADGVLNFQQGQQVVKFYLFAFEASTSSVSEHRFNPVAQVVMPVAAFVNTVAFFDSVAQRLVKDGAVSQAELDQTRSAYMEAHKAQAGH